MRHLYTATKQCQAVTRSTLLLAMERLNALAREKSPYLQQHAANPVDWLPWGEEAFRQARVKCKPILLSIGYAACHWCHVMARESFSDADTAEVMNQSFVNIKVDREERPDVDAIYLRALQAMGKRPGWPLTMFLTPTGKPFWGGTYFSLRGRDGEPGFREILIRVREIYHRDSAAVEREATGVIKALVESRSEDCAHKEVCAEHVRDAADALLSRIDTQYGGIGGPPKFPYPPALRFMWNEGLRAQKKDLQDATKLTLDCMIRGGLFDHLDGGFARYATDVKWQFPHFEKMLYDNALLIHLLSDVWRADGLETYRDTVQRTVSWLLREMTLPGGAFASSLDADSEGAEGRFYIWSAREIDDTLGADAPLFRHVYDVTDGGNFNGRNVLNRLTPVILSEADEARLRRSRTVLFHARSRRCAPRRDEKVLADWNGLAITALARAAATFKEPSWLDSAVVAFEFIGRQMTKDGRLHHSWCDGAVNAASILDDYANMAQAALSLYEATGRSSYLQWGTEWVERCTSQFCDARSGAYYFNPLEPETLVARVRDGTDAATPSGNGVMAQVLSRLYFVTGDDRYRVQAQATVRAFAADVERDMYGLATLLDASRFLTSAVQIVIVGDLSDETTRALLHSAHQHPGPDNIVVPVDPQATLPSQHPAAGKLPAARQPVAYVCAGTTCFAPAFDPLQLRQFLDATMIQSSPTCRPKAL